MVAADLVTGPATGGVDITSCCAYTRNVVRTQIQLTEQQARRLRALARERGVSLAEVIRRCVDAGLAGDGHDRAARYDRAARVVGRFADRRGARDLATRHDRYLDEAYE